MSGTVAIVASIEARAEHRKEVEIALRRAAAATLSEAGCEQYALHIDPKDPNRFVMIERWLDKESVDAHANGPVFTELASILKDRATLQVNFYEPIL